MLKYNPDTLVNYATQAYGDYVKSLCRQWMPYFQNNSTMTPYFLRSTSKKQESVDMKHIENICEMLHNMLVCTLLPPKVTNDVTFKLLKHVDDLFDADSAKKFIVDDELILSRVIRVLIHRSVTELNLQNQYFFDIHWCVMDRYVRRNLSHLRFLKVLNLGILDFQEIISIPSQNLHELTFCGTFQSQKITSNALQHFANSFLNLQKIVFESIYIDDVGLKFLLKFRHLEHLEFDDIDGFSTKGMTELLEGLAKNSDDTGTPVLKHLKCTFFTRKQIEIVVRTFHLVFFSIVARVKHIRYPIHLRSLYIFGKFSKIKNALKAVGHQLSHLHLRYLDSVDLCVVAECCPFLVSLKVVCYGDDMVNDSGVSLPSFSNLKFVELWGACPKILICILSNCTNVKVLKLDYREGLIKLNIADVLEKNPLKHIEELQLVCSRSDVDIEILQHCQGVHCYYWKSQIIPSTGFPPARHTYAVRLLDA